MNFIAGILTELLLSKRKRQPRHDSDETYITFLNIAFWLGVACLFVPVFFKFVLGTIAAIFLFLFFRAALR